METNREGIVHLHCSVDLFGGDAVDIDELLSINSWVVGDSISLCYSVREGIGILKGNGSTCEEYSGKGLSDGWVRGDVRGIDFVGIRLDALVFVQVLGIAMDLGACYCDVDIIGDRCVVVIPYLRDGVMLYRREYIPVLGGLIKREVLDNRRVA